MELWFEVSLSDPKADALVIRAYRQKRTSDTRQEHHGLVKDFEKLSFYNEDFIIFCDVWHPWLEKLNQGKKWNTLAKHFENR